MIVDGNNFISHHLKNDKLFAAGKIGITEGKILYFYLVHNIMFHKTFLFYINVLDE